MKGTRRAIDGVLLLDKPAGLSSGSAVGWAKRLLNAEKAGHTGTLDPFATGLLPICFGEAAKFSRFMLDADKGYRATLRLGEKSNTGDTEGEIVLRRPVDVTTEQVRTTLRRFIGESKQTPPMHSALKRDGVPLYKLARQGVEIERAPREIIVRELSLISLEESVLVMDTVVSKGTYIRVLAEDIGEALGCGAHLTGLRRTATGGFDIASAYSPEAMETLAMPQREGLLLTPDTLAGALPQLVLDVAESRSLCNGLSPQVGQALESGAEYRVYDHLGKFLGIVEAQCDDAGRSRVTATRLMSTGQREA